MNDYRPDKRLGGTDISRAAKDYEAWAAERRLKLAGQWPHWLNEESDAMAFGTLVHLALLEPEEYKRRAVPMPYVENFVLKAGKAVKEEAQRYADARQGGFVVRHEHAWAIDIIRKQFDLIKVDFGPYETEKTFFGPKTKGRVDIVTHDRVIDLKTTRDILRCDQTMAWERYPFQVSHYCELAEKQKGACLFVENVFPYRLVYKEIDDETFAMTNEARLALMERIEADGLCAGVESNE